MKNEEILKRKKFIFLMPINVWKLENNLPTEYLNGKQHSFQSIKGMMRQK